MGTCTKKHILSKATKPLSPSDTNERKRDPLHEMKATKTLDKLQ